MTILGSKVRFDDIVGYEHVKRGMEVAIVAGNIPITIVSHTHKFGMIFANVIRETAFKAGVGNMNIYWRKPCPCGLFVKTDDIFKNDCECKPSDILAYHRGLDADKHGGEGYGMYLATGYNIPSVFSNGGGSTRNAIHTPNSEPDEEIIERIANTLKNPPPSFIKDEVVERILASWIMHTKPIYDYIDIEYLKKIAQTIARMDGKKYVEGVHMVEALMYIRKPYHNTVL